MAGGGAVLSNYLGWVHSGMIRARAMGAPLPPLPPNIATLTAPLIIGELLGTYLFGILTVQFYMYNLSFPHDPKYIKWLVYVVFLLDLASTIMCFADSYHWFAAGYGNIASLNDIWLSAFDTRMIGAFLAAIVQCFYCYRLWKLNKYAIPVCIVVVGAALAQIIAGIYGAVVGHRAVTFAAAGPLVLSATYVVNIGAAAADVLIAITMTILLTRARTVHAQTDYIVKRIINLTVETNLLSSTLAVLTVILLVGVPNTNYFTCPSIVLGKIYSNSLLLMLNNRKFISNNVTGDSTARAQRLPEFRAATRDLDSTGQDISLQPSSGDATLASKGTMSKGVEPEWT
ncbi:hypothetical protein B0H15DRAFT_954439 [Mycena belliarum]|uniref:DUF6534 domain-containing protein n=1 Tax=Mycena belliarum TaxID=1033014 RepID=A0AAD6XL03_9AGAR|nr:hypothetical protein B0H15DRAFT_954439 [Mycena belliae]